MLCDSNIIIYAADPKDTRCLAFASHRDAALATVSRIEVLGFPQFYRLTPERRSRLQEIVASLTEMALTETVIQQAITLRQQKKMSLGDAIIAATALVHDMPLVTSNIDDFKHISDLELIDPFKQV